jgi:homoaconitate hydratase
MYGALGAIGTPIVATDAAAAWATGDFWWQIPRSIQVVLEGALPAGATGKDVIITLCGLYNHDEVLNAAVEFSGPGVASLSMDARFSISNMTTEWGALVGWFPVDEITIRYLKIVKERLAAQGIERFTDRNLVHWAEEPPKADPDAVYAARIVLDLSQVTPQVSGPDTVRSMASLAEIEKEKIAIQKAYLVSCVNARMEDLAAAATVLQGKKVALGVKLYLGAASRWVQEEAERRGIWQTLLDAGANPLPAGCGPCIGLGVGVLEAGEVGISATNQNFKGSMGSPDAKCYLASPEVVAASAVAGYIRGHSRVANRTVTRVYEEFATGAAPEKVGILPGFPERVRGRLVFLPHDNVNDDANSGDRDDLTTEAMANVVMENYDPQFEAKTKAGDVMVCGFNFGAGSGREQAVTCLKTKGIALVIAASFSQTYLRNAYNNGFLSVEVPALVKRLREQLSNAGEKTVIPGEEIEVDFGASLISWRGEKFAFPAVGSVPQSLVIARGVENLVAKRLGVS